MRKSCQYCHSVHPINFECDKKPKKVWKAAITEIDRFRWTNTWRNKSKYIKQRDKFLCQICIRKLYNTQQQYNYKDLEVHHIISLQLDFEKRLDDINLITCCRYHHELAESGKIPMNLLLDIVKEQENNNF